MEVMMRMMRIRNLTPHKLTIIDGENEVVFPPEEWTPRVEEEQQPAQSIVTNDAVVQTCRKAYGSIIGLPEPQEGVILVVSAMVAERATRADVMSPDTGPFSVVRDNEGRVLGVRRLMRWA
jgi:hypothetical protein